MRRIWLAGAALCLALLGIVPAIAQEPTYRHSGGYAGLTLGYSTAVLRAEDVDLAGKGAFGGAYLGFGTVVDGIYVGLEIDGMLRDIKPALTDGSTTVTFQNDWMASARARVGLPVGPALFYVTGGAAAANSKLSVSDFGSDSAMVIGWVAGAGIEAAFTKTIGIRVEALHFALPSETFRIDGNEATIRQSETLARVGLTIKLN